MVDASQPRRSGVVAVDYRVNLAVDGLNRNTRHEWQLVKKAASAGEDDSLVFTSQTAGGAGQDRLHADGGGKATITVFVTLEQLDHTDDAKYAIRVLEANGRWWESKPFGLGPGGPHHFD